MTTDLDQIKATLTGIAKGEGVLDMLMEFERTLDNAEVFSYKNWMLGELVEGPIIDRYWFKTVWMWPHAMMPDPNAGLRLTKLGANVNFRKGVFKKPVKVNGPQDWANINTKATKIGEHKVWLVTIELPLKYINRGLETNDETIRADIESASQELSDAYDDSIAQGEIGAQDEMSGEEGFAPPEQPQEGNL